MQHALRLVYKKSSVELDVGIGWLLVLCDLDYCRMHLLRLPVTSGHFLPTPRYFEAQVGHNVECNKDKSPNFFAVLSRSEGLFLYECLRKHHFIFYRDDAKERMVKILRMEEVITPPDSAFIAHGSVQPFGGEWRENYGLQYHIYLIPEEKQLKDANPFACSNACV